PARFMLVAAMNPCPCGFFGTGDARCICHSGLIQRYVGRISGPLHDRIDLHVEVPALDERQLTDERPGETSDAIRARVLLARERQLSRFQQRPGVFANGHMSSRDVKRFCRIDAAGEHVMRTATARLGLSARAYHRVLRIARTIADLAGAEHLTPAHLAEAIQYRSLDQSWPGRSGSPPFQQRRTVSYGKR
ncbi:MAG: ATP-binding protein, partial [Longimicrobiales bacterium]